MKFNLSIKAITAEIITPAKTDPSVIPIKIMPI